MTNNPLTPIPYFISYTPGSDTLPETFIQGLQTRLAQSTQYQFLPWNTTGTVGETEINEPFRQAVEACHLIILLLAPGYCGRTFLASSDLTPYLRLEKILFPIVLKPLTLSLQETQALKQLQWFHLTNPKTRTPLTFRDCQNTIQRDAFITRHAEAIEHLLTSTS